MEKTSRISESQNGIRQPQVAKSLASMLRRAPPITASAMKNPTKNGASVEYREKSYHSKTVPSEEAKMTFRSSVPTLFIGSSSSIPLALASAIVASPVRCPTNPASSVAVSYALDSDSAIAIDALLQSHCFASALSSRRLTQNLHLRR